MSYGSDMAARQQAERDQTAAGRRSAYQQMQNNPWAPMVDDDGSTHTWRTDFLWPQYQEQMLADRSLAAHDVGVQGGAQNFVTAVNPQQQALLNRQISDFQNGGGDYGFGQSAKAGNATLTDMLANRGIALDSGAGLAAQSNMLGAALAGDAQNRRNYGLQLAQANVPYYQSGNMVYGKKEKEGPDWGSVAGGAVDIATSIFG
jgi:hypothetical protein